MVSTLSKELMAQFPHIALMAIHVRQVLSVNSKMHALMVFTTFLELIVLHALTARMDLIVIKRSKLSVRLVSTVILQAHQHSISSVQSVLFQQRQVQTLLLALNVPVVTLATNQVLQLIQQTVVQIATLLLKDTLQSLVALALSLREFPALLLVPLKIATSAILITMMRQALVVLLLL